MKILVISPCSATQKHGKIPNKLKLEDFRSTDRLCSRIKELSDYKEPAAEMYEGKEHKLLMEGINGVKEHNGYGKVTIDWKIISTGFGLIDELYCHRKLGPLSKPRLWYNNNLIIRSIRWRSENEEASPPSLKRRSFLRPSAVKVPKQKCAGGIASAKTSFQSGSSSSLKMRKPLCLPPRISNPARRPSGSPTLNNSLGG